MKCKVCIDGMRLEHVSEFKYLGCVLDQSGTDKYLISSRKVASGKEVSSCY